MAVIPKHRATLEELHFIWHPIWVITDFTSPLVTDNYGYTPLHLAAVEDRIDCVESLVHANAPLL